MRPDRLALWTEFHEQVNRLPEEQREVFDLIWYQGLSFTEAAAVLGVAARTVTRRWHSALLAVHDALDGFVTFREVQHVISKTHAKTSDGALPVAITSLSNLCRSRDWGTSDPLAVPKTALEMKRRGHLAAAIEKVIFENPKMFLSQSEHFVAALKG